MTTKSLIFEILGVNKSGPATKAAAAGVNYLGGAFTKVGNIVGGDFGNAISTAGQGLEDFSGSSVKTAQKLQIAGGIVTGLGIALAAMGSKEAQASSQLKNSIADSGHSYDTYAKQIQDAIATGESFDHNSADTQTALAKLTTALGSPADALKQMSLVTNLAAADHSTLAAAAAKVVLVLGGKGTRVLNQYGIVMASTSKATSALTSAQKAVTTKTTALAKANENLTLTQQLLAGKTTLTAAEHVKLEKAQNGVTSATSDLATAQANETTAQKNASTANDAGQKALDQLSDKLQGRASSSVDNFGSQLDIVKTKIEDWVDLFGTKFGPAIAGAGGAVQVLGVGLELLRARQAAATAAAEAASTATDAETTSQVALDGAMDANPIGLVAAALGTLVALVGGSLLINGTKDLTAATTDYTTALQNQDGELQKNLTAVATKHLLDSGALAAAQKLGIGTATLVQATLGDAQARAAVNAQLDDQTKKETALVPVIRGRADQNNQLTNTSKALAANIALVGGSVADESQALKDAKNNNDLYNSGLGTTAINAAAAKQEVDNLAASIKAASALGPMVYQGGTLVPVNSPPSPSSPKPKPKLAAGGLVNPRRAGVDVTVAEAGNPELVAPLPRGFDLASAMSGGGGVTQIVNLTVKGTLVHENQLIRTLQKQKNNAQLRGKIAKGPF